MRPESTGATAVGASSSSSVPLAFMAAGALARCTAAIMLFPTDVLKTRLQFQGLATYQKDILRVSPTIRSYTGARDAVRSILREEGMMGFYRGLGTRLLYTTPAASVSFGCYEFFKATLHRVQHNEAAAWTPVVPLVAGGLARCFGTLSRTPFDLVSQRLQIHGSLRGSERMSALAVLRWIVRENGVRGLFRGYKVTLLRDMPFAGLYFSTYEMSKRLGARLTGREGGNTAVHLAAGAVAGTLASSLTIPFDVLKTRMQTHHTLVLRGRAPPGSVSDPFKDVFRSLVHIARTEGIRGLTTGLHMRLLHIIPSASITFAFYEFYRKLLVSNNYSTD